MRIAGLILIGFGILALISQLLMWVIPREVVDLGFLRVAVHADRALQWPFLVGLAAMILGTMLLLSARHGEGRR